MHILKSICVPLKLPWNQNWREQPVTHMTSTNSKPEPCNKFPMDKIKSLPTFFLVPDAVSHHNREQNIMNFHFMPTLNSWVTVRLQDTLPMFAYFSTVHLWTDLCESCIYLRQWWGCWVPETGGALWVCWPRLWAPGRDVRLDPHLSQRCTLSALLCLHTCSGTHSAGAYIVETGQCTAHHAGKERTVFLPESAECFFIINICWAQSSDHGRARVSTCKHKHSIKHQCLKTCSIQEQEYTIEHTPLCNQS